MNFIYRPVVQVTGNYVHSSLSSQLAIIINSDRPQENWTSLHLVMIVEISF